MNTKELYDLAAMLKENEKDSLEIVLSYKTDNKIFRDFVHSLKAPASMLPGLIAYFAANVSGCFIQKFSDVTLPGTYFSLENGTDYKYAGMIGGVKYASPINSEHLEELDPDTRIDWIF